MSFDLLEPDIQITPNRKTHILLDQHQPTPWPYPFGHWRNAHQMATAKADANARYVPGLGWELAQIETPTTVVDNANAQGGTLLPGSGLNCPDSFKTVTTFRQPTEFVGATDDATNLASTGDVWVQKQVPDQGTFNVQMPDPLPGIPPPDARSAQATYAMDRVAASSSNHDPNQPFIFEFMFPGASLGAALFTRLYCNCAPDVRPAFTGSGLYCFEMFGDGSAWCYQWGYHNVHQQYEWDRGRGLRWCESTNPSAGKHSLEIRPYAIVDQVGGGGYIGGMFMAKTLSAPAYQQPGSRPGAGGVFAVAGHATSNANMFTVASKAAYPCMVVPLIVEIQRIARMLFRLIVPHYQSSAQIMDSPFSFLTSPRTSDDPGGPDLITVTLLADIPEGTSINVDLFDITGTQCTPVDGGDGIRSFCFNSVTSGALTFQARPTLNSNSGQTKTPVWKGISAQMDGGITTSNPGSYDITNQTFGSAKCLPAIACHDFSITGGEDPSFETASFKCSDMTDVLSKLKARGETPCMIYTDCIDPRDGHTATTMVLFNGLIIRAPWEKFGRKDAGTDWPASNWGEFSCECVGDWKLLKDALANLRWNFGSGSDGNGLAQLPYIVDVVGSAFNWMGVPADRIDIPTGSDLPLQLSSPEGGLGQEFLVELGTDLAEYVKTLVYDYLAYRIVRDLNASPTANPTDYGFMWRVLAQNTPPYTYLASFVPDGSAVGVTASGESITGHIPLTTGAFPPVTIADQTGVQQTWYQEYRSYTLAPEGNLLIVSSTGMLDEDVYQVSAGSSDSPAWDAPMDDQKILNTIVVSNQASFNFNGVSEGDPTYPDPNDPDYLGRVKPIYWFDPAISDPNMLRTVAKRLTQQGFHAQKVVTFEAPLIGVWDSTDQYQCRPRPLRHFDAVAVTVNNSDGTASTVTGIIWSVHPAWEQDWIQMAVYEIWIPNEEFQGQLG